MTGQQPSDIQFDSDTRHALWSTGHGLEDPDRRVPYVVGTLEPGEQALSRAVARVQICPKCGKHFDSVQCGCEVTP